MNKLEHICSQTEEYSNLKKEKSINEQIKDCQTHLNEIRLKLTNIKNKKLSVQELSILKIKIVEIKEKYWLHLHHKTKEGINKKLTIINSELENLGSPKKLNKDKKNQKYGIKNNLTQNKARNRKQKCNNTNSKQKSLKRNCQSQIATRSSVRKSLHNSFALGSDHKIFHSQPIPKTNENIFSDDEFHWSDLTPNNKLNHSYSADQEIYNKFENLRISPITYNKEYFFILTQKHCKLLARSLGITEAVLCDKIKMVCENNQSDEFDDVSIVAASQSPITYKEWKNQKRTKINLNTQVEHFKLNFENAY